MKCKQTSKYYFLYRFIVIVLAALALVQPVFSGSVSGLYESSIKVDPTGTGKELGESQLVTAAFTQVLIKVSGHSDVASSPAYSGLLKKAESTISQFRYDYKEVPEQGEQQEEKKKEKWFWVRFNAKAINDLLKQAQIPVWGKIRPETLIWFSQEVKGKRSLQSQHDEPEIYRVFKQQADERGISLIFPFLDLQDQSSVSATDIWGNFNDAVLLASRRYQAQSTLTARLFKEPSGLWVSHWNLLMLGEVQSWEIRDEKLDSVLASGIDKLADKLSRQFTQVARGEGDPGVLIQINNISGFKDFQKLDDYLRNLATVKSIKLMEVQQDRAIYRIHYLSSKNSLIQEIRLGDLLNSVEQTRVDSGRTNNTDSHYKPVILGDLGDKSATEASLSDREKALNKINNPNGAATSTSTVKGSPAQSDQTTVQEKVPEKVVEALIPELEYWLAN